MVDQLFGKEVDGFHLDALLGRGGMGLVYKAVRSSDGAIAAIKILPHWVAQEPSQAKRFQREFRAAAAVHHPNLVRVQHSGHLPDGTLYLRMEFLAGENLRHRLSACGGRLPPQAALQIGAQLAQGLSAIHPLGIIHRDLKPSNIMLVEKSGASVQAKLLDFGIARFLNEVDDLTGTGQTFGTARYMAPEQCRGERELSAPVDLYALGVVLFEALTGEHPLQPQSETREEFLRFHLTMPPLSLSRLWPQAPAALVALVAQLLDKAPGRRPSAEQTAAELTQLVAIVPAEVLPASVETKPSPQIADATDPPQAPSLSNYLKEPQAPLTKKPPALPRPLPRLRWVGLVLGSLGLGLGVISLDLLVRHTFRSRPFGREGFERLPFPHTDQPPNPPPGMAFIPGGRYLQGSTEAQIQAAYRDCVALEQRCDEKLFQREAFTREVRISPFFLDITEVTNEAFADWLNRGTRGFDFGDDQVVRLRGAGIVTLDNPHSGILHVGNGYRVKEGMAKRPVVLVSWLGAKVYCQEDGRRLPHEAEWEFATSRGGTALYPWGDRAPTCEDAVALGRDADTKCPKGLLPAAGTMSLDISSQGVRDLAGSVSEWMLDRFVHSYWPCGACQDPVAPEDQSSAPLEAYRAVRGGSYFESRVVARAAFRSRAAEVRFWDNIGFRCVKPLNP